MASNILLITLILLAGFHVVILLGFVPIENVWGGQIESRATLIIAEIVALLIVNLFMLIVAVRANYIQVNGYARLFGFGTWVMLAFFALNTVGNLAAETLLEKVIFTPVTLILVICAWRLTIKE
jgi:hypothetical protein